MILKKICFILLFVQIIVLPSTAQKIIWGNDGTTMYSLDKRNIVRIDPKTDAKTIVVPEDQLKAPGYNDALKIQDFAFNKSGNQILIFANTARVWRYNTRGDYWLYDLNKKSIKQIGRGLPSQSLMFAKFSPDGNKIGYVSGHNIYVEDINTGVWKKLTNDGTRKLINGTFDWVYEEEFGCRDGFRWSPDSRNIAFWQLDATKIGDYFMVNTTDSVYSKIIPVEYPKVGFAPSPAKIGVVNVSNGFTNWMKFEGDASQHYIPRMEWYGNDQLVVQRLDRKQQESKLMYCRVSDGIASTFWADGDDAWVDLNSSDPFGEPGGFNYISGGQELIWISEKDGWRHIYKMNKDGKNETLLTKGNYDIGSIKFIDEPNNYIYFTASPSNPTQDYLYRVKIKSASDAELVTPKNFNGTNIYQVAPGGKIAQHIFTNYKTPNAREWITLSDHRPINNDKAIVKTMSTDNDANVEYMKVTTASGIQLDAWVKKPTNFDPKKKYPIVFYVYGEPAASVVSDVYGAHSNFLYAGDMSKDGYIQAAVDNRGTPVYKGRAWRKSIYKNIGRLNIKDMAEGMKKIMDFSYVDKTRAAVWGWSGGGSSTLNLLFQYPDMFKAGVAIAAVTSSLNYDNIYTERYMGLPQEDMEPYTKGAALEYAKNLKAKLLYIHGSGDDNVHISNADQLINALVAAGKQFELMIYPNRTHNISEGVGTFEHLMNLYTNFIRSNIPAGGK